MLDLEFGAYRIVRCSTVCTLEAIASDCREFEGIGENTRTHIKSLGESEQTNRFVEFLLEEVREEENQRD